MVCLQFSTLLRAQVPSSTRAEEAISRVKPILEKELNGKGIKYGSPIFIRIFKESKELEIWVKGDTTFDYFKTYSICTYSGKLGPKQKEGDKQAPEGFYFVPPESMNPMSSYHLAFNVGYPNQYDGSYARTGSEIMVHGECFSIGCFAMTNPGIDEIYALASAAMTNGQDSFQVHIFPFRMTKDNMEKYKSSEWLDFWKNLKEGYDIFEKSHIPPQVKVENKKYIFESQN
jgi:murein L,D-transpeptidase YafK